ncbi:MAG: hypothetical protein ACI4LP_04475 [Anaerovoracaceae bacterium]
MNINPMVIHPLLRSTENAAKRKLEKTTGEKPVTQKMFRAV